MRMDLPLWIEKARRGISIYPEDARMAEMYSKGKAYAGDIIILIVVSAVMMIFVIKYHLVM